MASTMKIPQWLSVTVLATASLFSVGAFHPTTASTFDNVEVNPDNFIAVAAPFGDNKYQLLIIEQIANRQACWSESGNNPVTVEPLLLNFDFTGICGRSTDSNGYSIRMNGQDLGLDYLLRIVQRNGELVLVGTNIRDRSAPEVEIGRTNGLSSGFDKIFLNPGWRFTRRTYQGKALGHIYLTNDSDAPVTQRSNPNTTSQSQPSSPSRELIFTKPDEPTASPESLPPLPSQDSQTPVYVVPVTPQAPVTGTQTLPPPKVPDATVPVLGAPR